MKKEEKEAKVLQFRGQFAELSRRIGEALFHREKIEAMIAGTKKQMLEVEAEFGKLMETPVEEETPPAAPVAVPDAPAEVK